MEIHGVFVEGNVLGPDILVIVGLVVLLFGGSQIPKLARSLGQASKEFKSGQDSADEKVEEKEKAEEKDKQAKPVSEEPKPVAEPETPPPPPTPQD